MSVPAPADDAAVAFNMALRRLDRTAECAALFHEAIAPFGFDTFACGEVDLVDRQRSVFYLIDWPDDWRRLYLTQGFLERDPLVEALKERHEPFSWTTLKADPNFSRADALTLERAAPYGWVEGLVVPVSQAGRKVGLVSLAGRKRGVSAQSTAFLCLISVCLYSHVRSLAPHEGFAEPPVGLTGRELASLTLAARGLPDAAIAEALQIAGSTAHEHIENAKRKLKASSRTEAVALAVSLGILDV